MKPPSRKKAMANITLWIQAKYLLRKYLGCDLGGLLPSQTVFGSIGSDLDPFGGVEKRWSSAGFVLMFMLNHEGFGKLWNRPFLFFRIRIPAGYFLHWLVLWKMFVIGNFIIPTDFHIFSDGRIRIPTGYRRYVSL